MKKTILLLLVVMQSIAMAQSSDNEAIVKTLNDVADAISSLHETHSPNSVLKHFDKYYVETEHRMYIDQSLQIIEEDYSDLEQMINGYANTQGLRVDYRIDNILKTTSKNNWGLIIAECEFDVFQNEKLQFTASEIQSISMVKKDNVWKLVLNQTTKFIDEVQRGECHCELYGNQDNENYVAKLTYPSGTSLSERYIDFIFSELDQDNLAIEVEDLFFNWNSKNGKIEKLDTESKSSKLLETKLDKTQALLFLIGELSKENCTSVKRKR